MKSLIKKYCFMAVSACVFLAGCSGTQSQNTANTGSDTVNKKDAPLPLDPNRAALVKINNKLFNVPSPLQLAGLLKKMNLPYNKELLNDVNSRSNYTTSFKQALNTGIYGADLGYINIYEQLPDAAAYFGAIRQLTLELGILNSFSEETMKRIERNAADKDSLLHIASLIYRESDTYLMNSERNETGALIIAGGWIEGLYLMTHAKAGNSSDELKELIGQQKRPLNNLIELLRPYYGKVNVNYDTFLENLSDIANIFDEINIKYTYKSAKTDEANKLTVINSESKAVLDQSHIGAITKKIEKLRNEIIK
ncbi:MAG: hypothetical protein II937_17070 [Bacteroidales bacterium]|nr:hypothetical protein [Bacteroidales bacterium]